MIKQFVQGEETDKELFGYVGRWLVLKKVQEGLGMAVTAEDGDVWHVYFNNQFPLGFAVSRPQQNGRLHLRFLFSDREAVGEGLAKAVLKLAKDRGLSSVHINDRDIATLWLKLGFTAKPQANHKPGHFIRWEKEIA